ncbi:MAG: hypothetical protein KAX80_08235, partial [Planctomycetes bacterium]|nr:hypothetical protein [Planctomycetota bacterium]
RYDQWRRTRPEPVFARQKTKAEPNEAGFLQATYGRGRVAFIERIEPALEPPAGVNHFGDRYWLPPTNAEALLAAVRWAAGPLPLEVKAPRAVAAELVQQSKPHRLLLHLLNYDVENPAQVSAALPMPEGTTVTHAALLSPDRDGTGSASGRLEAGVLSLELKALDIYAVFVIDLAESGESGASTGRGMKGVRRWRLSPNGRK